MSFEKFSLGVTGTGSLIGQAIIKSIRKSSVANEVEIIGFDYFDRTVGSYWCSANYILPDILKFEVLPLWVESVTQAIKKHGLKLLFVGVDFELPLFAKIKEQLKRETGCEIMVSDEDVIKVANDKYLTYEFLKKNNLKHPLTFLKKDYANQLGFPVIVKPRIGARSKDVLVIHDEKELEEGLSRVKDPIVQELVGDTTSEFTCGVIRLDGELKASIALNRTLREGNTFKSVYRKDMDGRLLDYVEKVANCLKPYGSCNFQLRLDEEGNPKIFEINARHSGTTYIRTFFGYNEVEYIINHNRAKETAPFVLREGTVIRYYDEFFVDEKSL